MMRKTTVLFAHIDNFSLGPSRENSVFVQMIISGFIDSDENQSIFSTQDSKQGVKSLIVTLEPMKQNQVIPLYQKCFIPTERKVVKRKSPRGRGKV